MTLENNLLTFNRFEGACTLCKRIFIPVLFKMENKDNNLNVAKQMDKLQYNYTTIQ